MNKFEATILISPDLVENKLQTQKKSFEDLIKDMGGSIVEKEEWGLRDLKYKIKSFKKAFYVFYQTELAGNKIPEIKKILSQNELILRHLFVKVLEHQKLPTKIMNNEDEK
tara:strand:- start:380 stop:712 length:333 start_codon:yes stop_codon:yes gene_type:complete